MVREASGEGVAFVGRSNMSWPALVDGIERNLQVVVDEFHHAEAA